MYLISIYFDKKTEQIMQNHINQVAKASGNTFMLDGNIPPHITVVGFEAKDEKKVLEVFENNIESIESGQIYFASLGVFKGKVIYVQSILNEYLHNISVKFHDIYTGVEDIRFNPYYDTFGWIPHLSIGKHLDEIQMEEAFKCLVKKFVPMEAQITKIGIAKTNPHRDIKVYEL